MRTSLKVRPRGSVPVLEALALRALSSAWASTGVEIPELFSLTSATGASVGADHRRRNLERELRDRVFGRGGGWEACWSRNSSCHSVRWDWERGGQPSISFRFQERCLDIEELTTARTPMKRKVKMVANATKVGRE